MPGPYEIPSFGSARVLTFVLGRVVEEVGDRGRSGDLGIVEFKDEFGRQDAAALVVNDPARGVDRDPALRCELSRARDEYPVALVGERAPAVVLKPAHLRPLERRQWWTDGEAVDRVAGMDDRTAGDRVLRERRLDDGRGLEAQPLRRADRDVDD